MAAVLPVQLKTADVQRFANRAAQLEKLKPIVAYWLEYHVLQQILAKGLHNESPEVAEYAGTLLDKIEAVKVQYANEPAIIDDLAAKAYMEQFASEVFDRAEKAQLADKVNRQTADSFQASATFFETLWTWGEPDQEIKQKIKFAKFHALRIAKAIKEGRDPNESNPKIEPPPEPVVDDVDVELAELATEMNANQMGPSQPVVEPGISPDVERSASIGGGYFPSVPATVSAAISSPEADRQATVADMLSPSIDSDVHIPVASSPDPAQYYKAPVAPPPVAAPIPPAVGTGRYKTDDDAVMAAQKHAKWAISALNFEDVPTAVQELRIALQALGGL